MEPRVITNPTGKVGYAVRRDERPLEGATIAKTIHCNDAQHSLFVDGDAMRFVAMELLAAADERDARRKAAAANVEPQKGLFDAASD